ncbi:MAG: hypothetical protein NT155_01405 [Candidatus Staskawiczbacteria bacterium]|nr:hypothetical protein [Candidatus Staskawiczbacteria bacterium]
MKKNGNEIYVRVIGPESRWAVEIKIVGGKGEKAMVLPVDLEKWDLAKNRLLKLASGHFVKAESGNGKRLVAVVDSGVLFKSLFDAGLVTL